MHTSLLFVLSFFLFFTERPKLDLYNENRKGLDGELAAPVSTSSSMMQRVDLLKRDSMFICFEMVGSILIEIYGFQAILTVLAVWARFFES